MTEGYGSTQATNTWISSDGSVTNYDPNTEIGFWISAFHNECDRSAHLEREIERLQADRDRWFKIADAMADCLDSSTDASNAMREYERAVRGE